MLKKLWKRTKEVATMYTGTFIVVMILNQLLFFGFCLNPICLIAAMPHVLLITVAIGTWLNKINGWGNNEVAQDTVKATAKSTSKVASTTHSVLRETEHLNQEKRDKRVKEAKLNEIQEFLDSEAFKDTSHKFQSIKKHESKENNLQVINKLPRNESDFFKPDIQKFRLIDEHKGLRTNLSKKSPKLSKPEIKEVKSNYSSLELEPPQWLLEVPPWTEEEALPYFDLNFSSVRSFIKKLNSYGIFSIWHITHKNNINNILKKGILSNKIAYDSVKPIDISNRIVQSYREGIEPIYKRKINEYTPTYINPKNPMLFSKKAIQADLCLIEISLSALRQHNFLFTDGNAAAKETKFYNNTNDLNFLPWDVLKAKYWTNFEHGKRLRCSEFLIYPFIEPGDITKIHCNNQEVLNYLQRFDCSASLSKELFFETEGELQTPSNSDPF